MAQSSRYKAFVVFLSVVITFYILLNYFLFKLGQTLLPDHFNGYVLTFIFISSLFIIGQFVRRIFPSKLSDIIYFIGSLWLAALLYFYLIALVIALCKLIFLSSGLYNIVFSDSNKIYWFYGSILTVLLIIVAGHINARIPVLKRVSITSEKNINLKMVVISDIHLGSLVGKKLFSRMINKIKQAEPDLIIFAGDLIDDDANIVIQRKLGEPIKQLSVKLGIYGITGNHDFIGNTTKSIHYAQECGIDVLKDEQVEIMPGVILIGRLDKDIDRFSGNRRKSLDEILANINLKNFNILLDHQPTNQEEVAKTGVDLCISGHTHHGQMWPLNYVTKAIYKLSWGHQKVKNTDFYVSCGLGTWGPAVRIGNRPEVVVMEINGMDK